MGQVNRQKGSKEELHVMYKFPLLYVSVQLAKSRRSINDPAA